MRWKSLGMPGNTHSLPSSRTTGLKRPVHIRTFVVHQIEETHHPDIGRDVEHLGACREERHPLTGLALLVRLVRDVRPVLDHLVHPPQRLRMVLERLVERLRERLVCDVCRSGRDAPSPISTVYAHTRRTSRRAPCSPSCVGPIPPDVITKS